MRGPQILMPPSSSRDDSRGVDVIAILIALVSFALVIVFIEAIERV